MNTSGDVSTVAVAAYNSGEGWLSTGTVAAIFGVSSEAIRRRCVDGSIPARRLGPNGKWRVSRSWVRATK